MKVAREQAFNRRRIVGLIAVCLPHAGDSSLVTCVLLREVLASTNADSLQIVIRRAQRQRLQAGNQNLCSRTEIISL